MLLSETDPLVELEAEIGRLGDELGLGDADRPSGDDEADGAPARPDSDPIADTDVDDDAAAEDWAPSLAAVPDGREDAKAAIAFDPGIDSMKLFMRAVGRVKLLSAEQEIKLARRIERGDLDAKRQMIEANLRLVMSIARIYDGRGLALADLVQEGSIGLIRAVEKFDYRRGCRFSTYATWWIRQSIVRAVTNKGRTIRIPVSIVEKLSRLRRAERALGQQLGRDPSNCELAAALEISVDELAELRRANQQPISLEQPLREGESGELGDLIEDRLSESPLDAADRKLRGERVRRALAVLPANERQVIELRFGLVGERPMTLDEIGRSFNLTRERIRQIETRTLKKMELLGPTQALRAEAS